MYKPVLSEHEADRELITSFQGYDCNAVIDENFFNDEENMSSDSYPALSSRNKRAFFNVRAKSMSALHSKSKLCYVKDGYLYYGGKRIDSCYLGESAVRRSFVSMGSRLIIFPDKLYVNTADFSDYGSLESFFTGEGAVCSMCKGDGSLYTDYYVGSAAPTSPQNETLWLDTSGEVHSLKQYSEPMGMWLDIADTYVRIQCIGIGTGFAVEDGVFLEGFDSIGLDGAHVIRDKGDDFITVSGILVNAVTLNNTVKVSRTIPDMEFVCESGNRLWGCSSANNEIYASKLGDPCNFNSFRGISTDSYAVSVGTDGEFTASTYYRGYVLFFKENCVHKIYGQNPPYTVTTSYIRGVQKGSHDSLVCINEALYYKSPVGICAYEGGIPINISSRLGNRYYTEAVGGTYMNKYYVCMTDARGDRSLFVFDTEKRIWHREDCIDICSFAVNNCNLYFVERIEDGYRLGVVDGENMYGSFTDELSGFTLEEDFSWWAKTGIWGLKIPENKYYGNFLIRGSGAEHSRIRVSCEADSEGEFRDLGELHLNKTGSVLYPITTPRCDHLRLLMEGKGKVTIYSLMRKIETGSDRYV